MVRKLMIVVTAMLAVAAVTMFILALRDGHSVVPSVSAMLGVLGCVIALNNGAG